MQRRRTPILLLSSLLLFGVLLVLPAIAQDDDGELGSNRPRPVTPGVPLSGPRVPEDACFPALPIIIGQEIFIEPGVNLRAQPTQFSASVWNTAFDNQIEVDGETVLRQPPLSVPAVVTDGPVCADGFNWWRVLGLGNPGWVAEGRPDLDLGYFIFAPDILAPPQCETVFRNGVGKSAEVTVSANLRLDPNPSGRVLTVVPAGDSVFVRGGPECVDNALWWFVRATVVGVDYDGWVAEATADGLYFLVPEDAPSLEDGTLCANPLPFVVGRRGFVDYPPGDSPKALRAAPSVDAPLLFNLVEEVPFVIVGGPACSNNLNWWQIQILTTNRVTGWMAEGSPGIGYWMQEVDPRENRSPGG